MKSKILNRLRGAEEFVSGQQLCEEFGVSRTAVWKAINQLKEEGYEIEAVHNKGYRLLGCPDIISAEEVKSRLHTDWAGCEVRYFDTLDSTNICAKRMAEEGAPNGTLVIADKQTAGRGRCGRVWETPKGTAIAMTLLMRPNLRPEKASMLTLVMGMAVTRGGKHAVRPQGTKGGNGVLHRWNFPLFCAGGALLFIVANPRSLVKPQDMAVPVNSATSGVGYGVQNGVRFRAHRHARGHRNSPPDCCYPDGLPCSSLSILSNKKSKAKSLAFFIGADYETRPVRFCAHRHACGHRNSPPDCCYPGGLPCSSLAIL